MSECRTDAIQASPLWRWTTAGLLAIALGGCATGGVTSSAFVDPSKYDLFDCPQLVTARANSNSRALELQGLMAKAETGVAGGLVSGLAYRSDYETAVAQRDLLDQKLASNNCAAERPPVVAAPPPAAAVNGKKKR